MMRCEESSTPSPASNNRMNGGSRHPSDLACQEIDSVDHACSSGCNQAFTMGHHVAVGPHHLADDFPLTARHTGEYAYRGECDERVFCRSRLMTANLSSASSSTEFEFLYREQIFFGIQRLPGVPL